LLEEHEADTSRRRETPENPMSGIERIGETRHALSAPARRRDERARPGRTEPTPLPRRPASPSHAALGRPDLATTRPVAAFLAQYVDQHWPWQRSPQRKAEQRQRATGAYIGADMLPDLLAATLRTGRTERKL
tara:strand:- start:3421 stop:3819 length:399 start_codon:yes stop_codon:yes gene_type:complete